MGITNYSLKSLRKGLDDPNLITKEFRRIWDHQVKTPVANILKSQVEKDNESRFGFVVHWSFYQNNRWGIAQTPYVAEAILNEFDPVVITTQKSYERHKDHLDCVVSFYPGFSAPLIEFNSNEHVTCAITSDPHNEIEYRNEYFCRNDVDYVLTHYYHPFKRHFPKESYEVVHFPWAVPDHIVADPDEITIGSGKLSILGDYRSGAYETRNWCAQFPFVTDSHKEVFANKTFSGDDYYLWLRNFDAVVAANSLSDEFRYVTAKFLEIPAAGALLFAQYSEDLERMGFTEENCVIFTKEDFERKAEEYLGNPSSYLERRRRGTELVASRHTVSDRMETLRELFD